MSALGEAIGRIGGNTLIELCRVYFVEETRLWTVEARAGEECAWSTYEGGEGELDVLLGLARDEMTGG